MSIMKNNNLILKKPDGAITLNASTGLIKEAEKDVFEYAIAAYGFLLPRGEHTISSFAEVVRKNCCQEVPRHKVMVETLSAIGARV
ncbi:hypothetical protein [Vibrio mediterranei]|uniref:hypothetical protein n=1 Tax=Vibrio mediterranei TaxID=689 RepID=UPI0040688381